MLIATVLETTISATAAVLAASVTVGLPVLLRSLKKVRESNSNDHERVREAVTLLTLEQQATRKELGEKIDRVSGDLSAHLGWHSAQPVPSVTNVTVQPTPVQTVPVPTNVAAGE